MYAIVIVKISNIFYVFIMPSFNFNNILLFHAGLLKCLPFRVNKIYVSFSPIGGIEYWGFIYMPQMRMHIICMNVTTKWCPDCGIRRHVPRGKKPKFKYFQPKFKYASSNAKKDKSNSLKNKKRKQKQGKRAYGGFIWQHTCLCSRQIPQYGKHLPSRSKPNIIQLKSKHRFTQFKYYRELS